MNGEILQKPSTTVVAVQPPQVGLDGDCNHYVAQKDSSKVSGPVRAGDAKQLKG